MPALSRIAIRLALTALVLGAVLGAALLSAPAAMGYYPKVGFDAHPGAWILDAAARSL